MAYYGCNMLDAVLTETTVDDIRMLDNMLGQ